MRRETVVNYSTVFDVWRSIYVKRPEIVKQTAKLYAPRPHGVEAVQEVEVLPRERVEFDLDERGFWGNIGDVKAMGALVEVRPDGFDPRVEYSGASRWNEGDRLDMDLARQRAFVLVDFESRPDLGLVEKCVAALKRWEEDWYLLDSGGSLHLIMDELILPEALSVFFGYLISDMAREINSVRSSLYAAIGGYLVDNWNSPEKMKAWAGEIREKFGHVEDPVSRGKLVNVVDMRYVAYVVEGIADGRRDQGFLRLTSKHGSVPVLRAQQVDGEVVVFECPNDPFDRRQSSLLGT